MFRPLRLIPHGTTFNFMRPRIFALFLSMAMNVASVVLVFTVGFNLGIDFKGGVLLEVQTPGKADLGAMRETVSGLGLGEVQLQEFGQDDVVLIRVQRQESGEACFSAAVAAVNKSGNGGYGLRDFKLDGNSASLRISTPTSLNAQSASTLAGVMRLPSDKLIQPEEGGASIVKDEHDAEPSAAKP